MLTTLLALMLSAPVEDTARWIDFGTAGGKPMQMWSRKHSEGLGVYLVWTRVLSPDMSMVLSTSKARVNCQYRTLNFQDPEPETVGYAIVNNVCTSR